ncbi:MAG: DUF983 domain-containing protein [Gammaproteobacteria bacterium]|nr:DUF983 domain-containing protein [Gammaproteobacteria bacterium]
MTAPIRTNVPPTASIAIWRGTRGRCPACGEGKLFKSYLRPNAGCDICGTDFSHIRSEDGPSWLTILLLGPVLVPIGLLVSMSGWAPAISIPISGGVITGAVLLLLPRVKGAFIGALFLLQSPDKDDIA